MIDFANNSSKYQNLQWLMLSDNKISNDGLIAFGNNSCKFPSLLIVLFN